MGINKDQVSGRADQAAGQVKEVVGKVLGNPDLEAEGTLQKRIGSVQATLGDVKEHVKDAFKKP